MPYVTEAARKLKEKQERDQIERQKWITLLEAIEEIKAKESCDNKRAVEDLFCAIVDGKVRALLGDIPYDKNSLSGYMRLAPNDLQTEIKVCLDAPGFIDVQHIYDLIPEVKNYDYPKISIVEGPIGEFSFDESNQTKLDALDFGPVLISRDDMQKWPFAPEDVPVAQDQLGDRSPNSIDVEMSRLRQKHGRPPGSGSFERVDAPLVIKMHDLYASGAAKSIHHAARRLANEAQGHGTPESKASRLVRRYKDRYSSDQEQLVGEK